MDRGRETRVFFPTKVKFIFESQTHLLNRGHTPLVVAVKQVMGYGSLWVMRGYF